MKITLATKDWTVIVMDADSRSDWTYKVLRGDPSTSDVSRLLHRVLRYK